MKKLWSTTGPGSKKQMFIKEVNERGENFGTGPSSHNLVSLCANEGVDISGDLSKEETKVFHEELGLQYKCEYSED
ncbi:Hypothetical predicted protein [Octopus vulgaris]|uniref:Uncharacterized protein n=1 Tax=Octopus vulgaris TaxID=6645 RepID=A0AA36F9J6_OCTVU|nr:Hypothetical predicted protein [Octopus vulgaris]